MQIPVIDYVKRRHNANYVDVITEPWPVMLLANEKKMAPTDQLDEGMRSLWLETVQGELE